MAAPGDPGRLKGFCFGAEFRRQSGRGDISVSDEFPNHNAKGTCLISVNRMLRRTRRSHLFAAIARDK